jgi:flavin-dependent thymidylate synthase
MKVELIDYAGAGSPDPARHAMNILVFTKQTRLVMKPGLLAEIAQWSQAKIAAELAYMANTIPSSWEFIDYTFLINGVTRGFTHQFVRTRTGSYAQQTMRVLDVNGWTYGTGPTIADDPDLKVRYDSAMQVVDGAYRTLIDNGAAIEDARGVLPTNIHTNIVAKFNLRNLADMFRKRASSRTQGEYRSVVDAMQAAVLEVHPWTELFFSRSADIAACELEAEIIAMDIDKEKKTMLIKLIDQTRNLA